MAQRMALDNVARIGSQVNHHAQKHNEVLGQTKTGRLFS